MTQCYQNIQERNLICYNLSTAVFKYPHINYTATLHKFSIISIHFFYKIIWIVQGFWLVNKCVFIVLWSTRMAWAMWLTVSKLWEFTVHASCIVFLFFKTENNNFIKEIKHVVHASIACWIPQQSLWEFSGRWKPSTASWDFTDLFLNSSKGSPRFSPGYEGMENMFYILNKYLKATFNFSHQICNCFWTYLFTIYFLHSQII